MKYRRTLYITQTAVMLALLIIIQFVTRPFSQLVTGSLVNLILFTSVLVIGLSCGLTISVISPFFAVFFQIGPPIAVAPFIVIGNIVLVVLVWLIRNFIISPDVKRKTIAAAGMTAASVIHMAFLWIGLVTIALPMMGLPGKQSTLISAMMTWPQLITALIGSALAMIIVPPLKKAMKWNARHGGQ
ncbi:MAG: ECF transporter S component [Oscillospiraceae bacterium]|jgi:hypothetical protein|nr:ECF transporter S component [Oscillospiraceae bacterium]